MKSLTIKKLAATTLALAAFSSALATHAYASGESNCEVIYGGGEVCDQDIKYSIDKLVQRPGKGGGNYVENLQVNDPKYVSNQNVNFKIIIQNTGDTKINDVRVTDTLPEFLTFVSGVGSYDSNTRKITFSVTNLEPGQKVEHIITAQVANENTLPSDQGVVCVINQVDAIENNGATAQDSSQVCIERQVLGATPGVKVFDTPPVKKIPETGPGLLSIALLIPSGVAGYIFAQKNISITVHACEARERSFESLS